MSTASEFDLQGYSTAISGLVEKAGAHVAAIKAAPYRVASGVIFRADLIATNNHLLKREGKDSGAFAVRRRRGSQYSGSRPCARRGHSASSGRTLDGPRKQKTRAVCGPVHWP